MMPLNVNLSQILQAIIIGLMIWYSSTLLDIKDKVTRLQANSERDFNYAADQRSEIKRRLDVLEQEMNTLRYKKQTLSI